LKEEGRHEEPVRKWPLDRPCQGKDIQETIVESMTKLRECPEITSKEMAEESGRIGECCVSILPNLHCVGVG
jgi:hypothetical protein